MSKLFLWVFFEIIYSKVILQTQYFDKILNKMSINRIGFSFKCLLSDWLYILLLTFFVAFCVLKYDTTIFCALNNELLSISLPSLTNELKLKHLRIKQLKCVVFKLYLFQLISTFIIVFFSQNINLEWETFVWIIKI